MSETILETIAAHTRRRVAAEQAELLEREAEIGTDAILLIPADREALAEAAPRIAEFARREGLEAHARSVLSRRQTKEKGETD